MVSSVSTASSCDINKSSTKTVGLVNDDSTYSTSITRDSFSSEDCKKPKVKKAPWYQGIVNVARKVWHVARKLNPFSMLLDFVDSKRISKKVENAKSRNNAKANKDLKEFHESIKYNESSPTEENNRKIFRSHFSDKPGSKPLIILFLGNAQELTWNPDCAGMNKLFLKYSKDNNVDVAVFRVGDAAEELKHKFFLSDDSSLHTSVVYAQTESVIEDITNGRGMFEGKEKPSKVYIAGYSWGGGTAKKVMENWETLGNGTKIEKSAYLDAIQLGTKKFGLPVCERPENSNSHFNCFQEVDSLLCGESLNKKRDCDISITHNSDHNGVDDDGKSSKDPIDQIFQFFNIKSE